MVVVSDASLRKRVRSDDQALGSVLSQPSRRLLKATCVIVIGVLDAVYYNAKRTGFVPSSARPRVLDSACKPPAV
jgi:hypothetical protein